MDERERATELRGRILESARHHGAPLPGEMALAWHGYPAAVLEGGAGLGRAAPGPAGGL